MSSDRDALQDLMLTYAAAVDERDRARYAGCFAADVEVIGFGAGPVSGRDNWLAYVFSALEKYQASQHLLGPPLANVDGDRASLRTDFQAMHRFKDGGEATRFTLWATYHTEARRIDGQWRITRHELVVRDSETV